MKKISMVLDVIPRGKGRPRFSGFHDKKTGKTFGKAFTDEKTKNYEGVLRVLALRHRPKELLCKQACLTVKFFMPIPKSMKKNDAIRAYAEQLPHLNKPDLDNMEKSVKDAMNGIIWTDDSIVWSVFKKKMYSKNPRIELVITGE